MDGTISAVIGIGLGVVALFVLWNELKARRQILISQLNLQELKFQQDEIERDTWTRWLERERLEIGKLSGPLSLALAEKLSESNVWAVEALEKAKLGPYAKTLFGDRSSHFSAEKKLIAARFAPLLWLRCKNLVEEKKQSVILVIDSGTTLTPFFKLLGELSVQARENNETWPKNLTIYTNNIPGIQAMMEFGRPNPSNRYSGLAVDCHLLPGAPLPVYSAVTGKETEEALKNLRKLNKQKVIIGVMAGNWIRIRNNEIPARCPIPLGRGDGHLEFKQAMLDIADETYVVSSLGKIFANVSNEKINQLLGYRDAATDLEKKPYLELKILECKTKTVKLVTTSRKYNRLLHGLYSHLCGSLGMVDEVRPEIFITANIGEAPHLAFMFDDLPNEKFLEETTEFPHKPTRTKKFLEFFLHPERHEPK